MTEIKFDGPATVTGFPRDALFSTEVGTNVLTVKANGKVFLTIVREAARDEVVISNNLELAAPKPSPEKEAAPTGKRRGRPKKVTTEPTLVSNSDLQFSVGAAPAAPSSPFTGDHSAGVFTNAQGQAQVVSTDSLPAENPAPEPAEKRGRGPNKDFGYDPEAVIMVNTAFKGKYSKSRGQWFDALETGQGRTVSWWENTALVKGLTGEPKTFLRFFVNEGAAVLLPPARASSSVQPITGSVPGAAFPQQSPALGQGFINQQIAQGPAQVPSFIS